jgi:hypothetical protein
VFDVFAGLATAEPLVTADSARPVFAALAEHAPAAMPDRWGYFEPFTLTWTPDMPTDQEWRGQAMDWNAKPATAAAGNLSPAGSMRLARNTAGVNVRADRQRVDPTGLVSWVRSLAVPLRADFGYLHVASEPDAAIGPRAPGAITAEGRSGYFLHESAATINQGGIAELLWGSLFGPAYVRLIGADRLRAAPAAVAQELGPETFWLQVTADPTDPVRDWPAFDTARQQLKAYLGADLFDVPGGRGSRRLPEWS